MASAERLSDEDPELAYAAIHDGVRKATAAMLQAQGLRPTTRGGHLAVQQAVQAQLGSSMGNSTGRRILTTRHRVEYPDSETWIDSDAVLADLPAARELVRAADKAIGPLTVFTI